MYAALSLSSDAAAAGLSPCWLAALWWAPRFGVREARERDPSTIVSGVSCLGRTTAEQEGEGVEEGEKAKNGTQKREKTGGAPADTDQKSKGILRTKKIPFRALRVFEFSNIAFALASRLWRTTGPPEASMKWR